ALAGAGDEDPVGARRVKALVSLAREGADQLAFGFAAEDAATAKTGGGVAGGVARPPRQALKLYVHTSLADLVALAAGTGDVTVAEVERLGAITSELVKSWLDRTRVSVTPVLDLADATWSPRHDPPPRMRDQVVLRHRGCVFPYCGRDARSGDLDHVEPWDPDRPGEPNDSHETSGTRPDNLAPLCRRHHRVKTHGRWRYEALPDPFGDPTTDPPSARPTRPPEHLWIGPHGETFLVTQGCTLPVGDP
ncbi:HNH endonuclease, partial [Nocardioides sp. Y6]